jgi:hypothetical protein
MTLHRGHDCFVKYFFTINININGKKVQFYRRLHTFKMGTYRVGKNQGFFKTKSGGFFGVHIFGFILILSH